MKGLDKATSKMRKEINRLHQIIYNYERTVLYLKDYQKKTQKLMEYLLENNQITKDELSKFITKKGEK